MSSSTQPSLRWVLWLVFGAALLGRLFTLQAFWCLDDWGQMARAAGALERAPGIPGRILSQYWWWTLVWPWLGFNPVAHAVVRMGLHALAAVAVTRIARRVGASTAGSLLGGLVFGASPVAFTVLYWASGIQELLAGVLALWAVERWLRPGRAGWVPAALCAGFSFLAKESGLGLPLFFLAGIVLSRQRTGARLGVVVGLFLLAGWEGFQVLGHFASGPLDPYATGGVAVIFRNLAQFGLWLGLPTPVFPPAVNWPHAGWGFLFWGAWLAWSVRSWRGGHRVPAAALAAALLSLGPALPLVHQGKPYMAYVAVGAWAVALSRLVSPAWNWTNRRWVRGAGVVLAVGFSLVAMNLRLRVANDPVVQATELSRGMVKEIQAVQIRGDGAGCQSVVVFQQPVRPKSVQRADELGPAAVRSTRRHGALQGTVGLGLVWPGSAPAQWVNSLLSVPADAYVFCETGKGFEAWGPCRDALFYAALIDVLVGNHGRAAGELARAGQLGAQAESFPYQPAMLSISAAEFRAQAAGFGQWLTRAPAARVYAPAQQADMVRTLNLLAGKLTG